MILDEICQSGDFLNGFVYHIAGMPWAATDSAELKILLDAGDANAIAMRKSMFGDFSDSGWESIQVFQILENIGSKTISYDESKGLNVSGFTVNLNSNPSGFKFENGIILGLQTGIICLGWQPVLTTPKFSHSVLGANLECDTTTGIGFLYWPTSKDFGLTDWLDNSWAADMVAGWVMDDAAEIYDIAGSGFDGTGTNVLISTTEQGPTATFNGIDSHVTMGTALSASVGGGISLTFAAWINIDDLATGTFDGIISIGNLANRTLWIYTDTILNIINVNIYTTGGSGNMTVSVIENQWFHFVVIYNGTTFESFVNGISIGSLPLTGTVKTAAVQSYIGHLTGFGYLCGSVAYPKIFNVAKDYDWVTDEFNRANRNRLWVGSTAIQTTGLYEIDGENYKSKVFSEQFNTPNEWITSKLNGRNIFITNYPQSIQGMTASLYGYKVFEGALNSPTKAYMFATGKVKPNASESGGIWSIQTGGETEQLKIKVKKPELSAHLNGWSFSQYDYDGVGVGAAQENAFSRPDLILTLWEFVRSPGVEGGGGTITGVSTWRFDMSATFKIYESDEFSTMLNDVVDGLNALVGTLAEFVIVDGDIQVNVTSAEDPDHYFYHRVSGPLAHILGLGYFPQEWVNKYLDESLNPNPVWMSPYITDGIDQNIGFYEVDFVPFVLKRTDENDINASRQLTYLKNRGSCSYYYSYNLLKVASKNHLIMPSLSLKNQTQKPSPLTFGESFQYNNESEATVEIDDVIQFGPEQNGLSINAVVVAGDFTSTTFTTSNIDGLGWGFFWNDGLQNALKYDKEYINEIETAIQLNSPSVSVEPGVRNFFDKKIEVSNLDSYLNAYPMTDPFEITVRSQISDDSPVDILKQLLGDPTVDTGIPKSLVQSAIRDLSDRGANANYRTLIDWDSLQAVIDAANYDGITYQLKSESEDVFEFNIITLIQSLLITHGGSMVWEWNENQAAFWLTFKTGNISPKAITVIEGRDFDRSYFSENVNSGIDGGEWHYNKIEAKYTNLTGGTTTIPANGEDSRVQHTLGDKTLGYNDQMTVIPFNQTEAVEDLTVLIASYLRYLSQPEWMQTVPLKLSAFTRLPVGRAGVFEWEGLMDRETGQRGIEVTGDIRKLTWSVGRSSASCSVEIATSPMKRLGIGPTVAGIVTLVSIESVIFDFNTSTSSQEFTDSDIGLTDAGYFNCWNYVNGAVTERGCSCSAYRVVAWPRHEQSTFFDPAYAYASQNVWEGEILVSQDAATLDNGTQSIVFVSDSTHRLSTVFEVGDEIILQFINRADANIQPCQTRLYGWYGNSSGQVIDSFGNVLPAITAGE